MASSTSTSSECVPLLTISQAKCALTDAISAMNDANNISLMRDARNKCDNGYTFGQHVQMDMIRHMQFIFPIATQILMDVISNYGFAKNGEGVIQFTLAVKDMERVDEDVARLNNELRTYFLPNISQS